MAGTVAMLARHDLRRRSRRVVLVMVLVGFVGAFALSAAAGARRAGSALARFRTVSLSADIELTGTPTPAQLRDLARIPGVAAFATLRAIGLIVPAAPDLQEIGAPVGPQFGRDVDRDRIVSGRSPNPTAVDEITLGEGSAARLHLHAGDPLEVESFSPRQIAQTLGGEPNVGTPAGPHVRLQVVGIVRGPLDLGDRSASGGLLVLTPAFDRAYAGRIGVFGYRMRIRTVNGAADVAAVLAESRRVLGRGLFSVQELAIETQAARNAIDVASAALWIAAIVAAVAGGVAIVIVLTRELASASREDETYRDLGCTRFQRVAMFLPAALIIAVGGAGIAAVGAVALSSRYPFGVARRADPEVGIHADWTVLVAGIAALTSIVLVVAFIAALRSTASSSARRVDPGNVRTAGALEWAAAAGLRPPVYNGVRMALQPGHGRSAVPLRSAFFGVLCGVVAVAATAVFVTNLDHLAATPRLYGASWDFSTADQTSNTPCGAGSFGLVRLPGIAALTEVCSQNVEIDGRAVPALAFTPVSGRPFPPEMIAGRAPVGTHEVALGTKTLHALHKRVGDTVHIVSRARTLDYTVVGRTVFPTFVQALPFSDGASFTGAGYAPLFDRNIFSRYFVGSFSSGSVRNGVDQRIDAIPELGPASRPQVPAEIDRLRQVGWLPLALATFVGGLAALAVAHAIVTAVRRRRRELAILKTLGFTRRQVRATVGWQASTLGVFGAVLGIPGGILLGRLVWEVVADGLGVDTSARVPLLAVVLIAACALAIVNAIAYLPGRAAARIRAGVALRSE